MVPRTVPAQAAIVAKIVVELAFIRFFVAFPGGMLVVDPFGSAAKPALINKAGKIIPDIRFDGAVLVVHRRPRVYGRKGDEEQQDEERAGRAFQ